MRSCLGFVSVIVLVFSLLGCKQGEGERCQIDDDCEGDLRCVREGTNHVCRSGGAALVDASTVDAPPPVIDAEPAPDAPAVDGAPVVDGAQPDAP